MAPKRRRSLIALSVALPLLLIAAMMTDLKYLPAYIGDILRGCPEPYRGPAIEQPFLVIGHRGAAATEVENTLPSFRHALEIDSVNGLELDLCMTKDSVIVVWHDWDPDSPISEARELGLETDVKYRPLYPPEETAPRRLVHTLTLEELRKNYGYTLKEALDADERKQVPATIPTLEEFLSFVGRYDRLRIVYFDLKIPEEQSALTPLYFNRIRSAIAAAQPRFTYVFITPHEKILAQLEQMDTSANFSFDVEPTPGLVLKPWEKNSVTTALRYHNAYASTVHPKASTWAPWTTLKRLIENDVRMRDEQNRTHPEAPIRAVVAATISEPEKMECLIATGVDGLITDDAPALRKVARQMGRKVE